MHLEDCPSGNIDEPSKVEVDISPKSSVNKLKVNGNNALEADGELELEANVLP